MAGDTPAPVTTTAPKPSPTLLRHGRPEILAPAGTHDAMRAAVENGADAVYFGLQDFNARQRAANFETRELPDIMRFLHERGVRGYVTMNVLIFVKELEAALDLLRACSRAGVDAVLVQDLGLAVLAARAVPELPIHASTQMTMTCAESIAGAARLGIVLERVVAPRELSRKELRRLTGSTPMPIETFVHGALCVAYSGQCLTSESLGGRSANRGECAQACRLPYDLVIDGTPDESQDVRYVLSPKDLAAYEDLGDLVDIGIASFKIEGRLKAPAYVAATTRSYRAAVDAVIESVDSRGVAQNPSMTPAVARELQQVFSRGLTGGYLHEINHQVVVEGRYPKKRGVFLGRIDSVGTGSATIALEAPLRPGDGVVFDAGRPEAEEEGGAVYELFVRGRRIEFFDPSEHGRAMVELRFARGGINFSRIKPGDFLWKTSDPRLEAELRATWAGDLPRFRRPVHARVSGAVGRPLTLELRDDDGVTVQVEDTAPAEQALKRPLDATVLRDQLGRLGNTPFELGRIELELDGSLMVPMSRLNDLRRRAVEALRDERRRRGTTRIDRPEALAEWRAAAMPDNAGLWYGADAPGVGETRLGVLARTLDQVREALEHESVSTIYTDFEDIRVHREARALIPKGGRHRFVPASLRIVKPGEGTFVRKLLEAEPDGLLVRGLAAWEIVREQAPNLPVLADYAMNIANDLTARLLREAGAALMVPSYDLNGEQLLDLLRATPSPWWEVTIHQHMPMFHMEHCVFCRFLSTGTDFTNCGRPCESHTLALRDRMGHEHPVKADAGCRNTVFNAVAQSGSEYADALLNAGVRAFRIDLLTEDRDATRRLIRAYAPVLRGERPGTDLWRELKATARLGVTRGTLDHD